MEIEQSVTELFEEAGNKMATGLGGMLGCELEFPTPSIRLVSKKEFFTEVRKKQVMVRMRVTGDHEGEVYVFCRLKDAVYLGGTLIMLPPAELEERVKKEIFGEEENDSFGEIANIVSGELCSAFDEFYSEKLHFKKADLESVVPSKVKMDALEPFPPGHYLIIGYPATMDGKALDELILLFPAAMLGVQPPEAPEQEPPAAADPSAGSAKATTTSETSARTSGRLVDPEEAAALLGDLATDDVGSTGIPVETVAAAQRPSVVQPVSLDDEARDDKSEPVILVVSVDGNYGPQLNRLINGQGYNAMLVDRKENFKDLSKTMKGRVKGLILVMEEIGEQSFSVAIKVRTAFGDRVPMMAAGDQWTRSKVLQAVKYGVCDILVTPASEEEVLEKVATYFKAAQSATV